MIDEMKFIRKWMRNNAKKFRKAEKKAERVTRRMAKYHRYNIDGIIVYAPDFETALVKAELQKEMMFRKRRKLIFKPVSFPSIKYEMLKRKWFVQSIKKLWKELEEV